MIKSLSLIFIFSTVVALIQSCSDNDPRPKEVLLTVEIDPGYFYTGFDAWIFISDKNGNPIDVRQATDSTLIKFIGAPQSTITFSIFNRSTTTNGDGSKWTSFGFDSYQEIPIGSTIQLKRGVGNHLQIPDVIGAAPFTLQEYEDSDKPEDALVITDGISTPYSVLDYSSNVQTGTNFSSQLYLRKNPSTILVTTYRNDVPVYYWLNDVSPNETMLFDFDSFIPSKTISINKQVALGTVKTMKGADFATAYIFSDLYSRQVSKSSHLAQLPILGYLDGFEKYFVSVAQHQLNAADNLYYSKAGTIPLSINLPDYSYSIISEELHNVSLNFSNDYSYKQANFLKANSESQVFWNLNASDKEDFKAPKIPVEIQKLYPTLNTDGIKLQFAAYTHWLDGYTYLDAARAFLTTNPRDVYEELRYVVKP